MWMALHALISSVSLLAIPTLPESPAPHRVAIVVGANDAAPGRANLRFAHQDAQTMADALVQVGHFQSNDVEVLLDPSPDHLLEQLDKRLTALRAESGETLLLFYYSGHADERSLYPQGKPLALSSLRQRLEKTSPTVRIGIIDACRGGAWTQAKGLSAEPPFEVQVPLNLATEGSVLISASSGLESAHESDSLQGSFFTHYFVAGMRGAATQSTPGTVTLNEVFSYAQERTVRDTALQVGVAQHPSFSINLKGRNDLTLANLDDRGSAMNLHQLRGPLQLIQSSTGIPLLELPEGERQVTLAVPAGLYYVRRADGAQVFATEVAVQSGQTISVDESSLTPTGGDLMASKSEPVGAPWWHSVVSAGIPVSFSDGSVEVGLGAKGTYYFQPLFNDDTEPADALELIQKRDSVSFSAGLLQLDGALGWDGKLESRIYPWGSTGLTASASVADAPGANALETGFSLGMSQYFGDGLRLDVGYTGSRKLEGGPDIVDQSVLLDISNYNGGYANVSWLLPGRRLRLDANLGAGEVSDASTTTGVFSGFDGKVDLSATLYLTHAWSVSLEGGTQTYLLHDTAGEKSTLLAPQVGVGVTRYFSNGLSLSALASEGYGNPVDNLQLQSSTTVTLGISQRF